MSEYGITLKTIKRLAEDQLLELCQDLPDQTIIMLHGALVEHLSTVLEKWSKDAKRLVEAQDKLNAIANNADEHKDVDDAERYKDIKAEQEGR